MKSTMNVNGYKGVFTIIAVVLTAWLGCSDLVYAGNPYSLGTLNEIMKKKLEAIPKNEEQPYVPYGQGNMGKIRDMYNKAKESENQAENLRVECANGNDNACIEVGVDTADPCRSSIADYQARDYCRLQQCMAGNQNECDKSKAQSARMNRINQATINQINNKDRYDSKSKESYNKSNLDIGANYCLDIWDYDKHICATADTLKRMDGEQ
jgi:hypothetical protein